MPVYEFRCETCDRVFEVMRSRAEAGKPARCAASNCRRPKRRPARGGKGQRIFSASVLRLSITDAFGEGLEGVAEVDRVGGGGGGGPPGMDGLGDFDDDF